MIPETIQRFAEKQWTEAIDIWTKGGWAMIAIAVIAFVMFGVGVSLLVKLRRTGYAAIPERKWRRWMEHPHERQGPIGDLMDEVMACRSVEEAATCFDSVRQSETRPFERDLRVMKTAVSAAPLVGLLGTVTGMLTTFQALSAGSGGDKTMEAIAGGISEALITTETGLVIALPGLFFQYQLSRMYEGYRTFLAHLETVCSQSIFLRQGDVLKAVVRKAAKASIAAQLVRRMKEREALPSAS